MKVYFISGLGSDRSMFKYIRLPEGYTEEHLDWISPEKNESLQNYAARLSSSIDLSSPFIIVGLSLGGMLAVEISKQFSPVKTILISSIPCRDHLPVYFKIIGKLSIHKMVPVSVIKRVALMKRKFTSERSADKKLLSDAIRNSDPVFIKWGMNAVLNWTNKLPPQNYIHIHGSRDEVLPIMFTKPTHIIKGGSHLMVFTKARQLNSIIAEVLSW